MSTKEAYKQKMEAELELAQAKLDEFRAQAKSSAADMRIKTGAGREAVFSRNSDAVDKVISKPFTLTELDETIQNLSGRALCVQPAPYVLVHPPQPQPSATEERGPYGKKR